MLQNHPEYQNNLLTQSFDEERRIAARRALAYSDIDLLSITSMLEDLKRTPVISRTMMQLSPSSSIKHSVGKSLFTSVLRSQGTERHLNILERAENGEVSLNFFRFFFHL